MDSDRQVLSVNDSLYCLNLCENQKGTGCTLDCDIVRYVHGNQSLSSANPTITLNIAHRPSNILSSNVVFSNDLQDLIPYCLVGSLIGNALSLTLCRVHSCRLLVVSRVEHTPVTVRQAGHQWENVAAWIVDGPRVVCVIDDRLYINDSLGDSISMSLVYVPTVCKSIKRIFCVESIPVVPSILLSPLQSATHDGKTFIFGTAYDEGATERLEFTSFCIDTNRKVFLIDDKVVPRNYCENISAAKLLKIRFPHTEDPTCLKIEIEMCILTTVGQLLLFSCGHLLKCISLPFGIPGLESKILSFQSFTGEAFVVLLSKIESKCLVVKDTSKRYEIVQILDGIQFAVVDDFIECGAEQLLLGSNSLTCKSVNLSQFLLSDFSGHHMDTMKDADDTIALGSHHFGGEEAGNLLPVVQALESRVQASYESLTEAMRLLVAKKQVVQKSNSFSAGMKEREENLKESSCNTLTTCSLVNLFTGKSHHSAQASSITVSNKLDLEVQCTWQKIIMQKWVIGLQCKNTGHRNISWPHLMISPSESQTKATVLKSMCFSLIKNEHAHNAEATKRVKIESCQSQQCGMILPGQEKIMTVTLDMPCLHNKIMETPVLLEWITSAEPNTSWESNIGTEIAQPPPDIDTTNISDHTILHLCTVRTTISDIFSGEYDLDLIQSEQETVIRNMITLNSVQQSQEVTFTSIHMGRLSNIVSAALDKMEFTVWHGIGPETYIFNKPGPLKWVRCTIQEKMYCKLNAILWTRDKEQLALFVQAWYATLPEDVMIYPRQLLQSSEKLPRLLECIQNEASFGIEVIKDLTMEPRTSEDTSLKSGVKSWDGDGIKRYFAEKRRLSHINVDFCKEKYKQFVKQSELLAQETDKKAMDLDIL